jgi:hypothetical protein
MKTLMLTAVLGVSLAGLAVAESGDHLEPVGGGWYSCERGYILRGGECVAETAIPPGPEVIVSDLPSAGEGAPTTCPSGGCDSFAPSYWRVYSGPTYGGWSHSRRFRGGDLVHGHSGLFGQRQSFMVGGFLSAPQTHFHPMPERNSHPGTSGAKFFGGSSRGVAGHRSGKGRTWR